MAVLRNAPGPGAYKLKPTIGGEQIDSTKASATAVHFMGATRDAADKIFISLEHEKAGYGLGSAQACRPCVCRHACIVDDEYNTYPATRADDDLLLPLIGTLASIMSACHSVE